MENTQKWSRKRWPNREYHVQHNIYVDNQYMKMYCATKQFNELQFIVTHNKTHGLRGLLNHYHMRFYPKLGRGTCAIHCIPCDNYFTSMIKQPWATCTPVQQQPRYKPVKYFTYWPVSGYFNI